MMEYRRHIQEPVNLQVHAQDVPSTSNSSDNHPMASNSSPSQIVADSVTLVVTPAAATISRSSDMPLTSTANVSSHVTESYSTMSDSSTPSKKLTRREMRDMEIRYAQIGTDEITTEPPTDATNFIEDDPSPLFVLLQSPDTNQTTATDPNHEIVQQVEANPIWLCETAGSIVLAQRSERDIDKSFLYINECQLTFALR